MALLWTQWVPPLRRFRLEKSGSFDSRGLKITVNVSLHLDPRQALNTSSTWVKYTAFIYRVLKMDTWYGRDEEGKRRIMRMKMHRTEGFSVCVWGSIPVVSYVNSFLRLFYNVTISFLWGTGNETAQGDRADKRQVRLWFLAPGMLPFTAAPARHKERCCP